MRLVGIIMVSICLLAQSAGRQKPARPPAQAAVPYAQQVRQGFSMKLWLSNRMAMGLQAATVEAPIGLEYPAGSGMEHLFGAGPWVGGIIDGVRRVSEAYNGDSGGGWLRPDAAHPLREHIWFTSTNTLNEPNRRGADDDGDVSIDEDDLDGADNDGDWIAATDDVGADGLPDALESGCEGAYNVLSNPDPAFDNYDTTAADLCHVNAQQQHPRKSDPDLYTERNGIPDHGEPHVDEDYGAVSESDYYLSATDTAAVAGHFPMGIKIVQKSYAWPGPAGEAILPMEYSVINIGPHVIHDLYFTFFADVDIGPHDSPEYPQNNYLCFMDSLKLAYGHNPVDRNATPLGVMILGAPRPLEQLQTLFHWWDFTSPTPGANDSILYVWMSGGWIFPRLLIDPCQEPGSISDSRFFVSVGPIPVVNPGDTLKYSLAFISGSSIDMGTGNMVENAKRMVVLYHRSFAVPLAPPSPPLRVSASEHRVVLDWSVHDGDVDPLQFVDPFDSMLSALPDTHWRRRNNPEPRGRGGRAFEGFKVLRSGREEYDSSSFVEIAKFDVDDDLRFGAQKGLRYSYVDSTVYPGKTYWYAVTSYSIPGRWVTPTYRDSSQWTIESPGQESRVRDNATRVPIGFHPASSRDDVLVVPNPYRGDNSYPGGGGLPAFGEAFQGDNGRIWFIHLPAKATIRIFSLVGDEIAVIEHDDAKRAASGLYPGQEEWQLLTASGRALAPGIFLFTVESSFGKQIGKFVILR